MPNNFNYMNQSAPFWDFLASLEQQGSQHPFFARTSTTDNEHEQERGEEHQTPPLMFGPWSWGQQFFGGPRGMPHRGPPPHHHGQDEEVCEKEKETERSDDNDAEMNGENNNGEGSAGQTGSDNEDQSRGHGRGCGGRHGRYGPGGPGGFGGPREFHHREHGRHGPGFGRRHGSHHGYYHDPSNGRPDRPHGPSHERPGRDGGPPHGRRGPRGPWGRGGHCGGFGGPWSGAFDPVALATQFWSQFNDSHPSNARDNNEGGDFAPEADIFDTESAFVVHVSLPGAKKEDVGVNWDVEKSELSVAGVIYRPGDEEFLKTLAMDERKVGPFERKIRLGTRASPAHIDADGIMAKLEDGILRIEVPKMDGGFVEIKKVDIE
ncbi:hypothetical protein ACN47E_006157 [Coniothyrium glycines]